MPRKLVPLASATILLASASLVGIAPPATAAEPFAFAVIGDVPYGSTQFAAFPRQVDQINADPQVQLASHLGDLSSPLDCSNSYYSTIKSQFDRFADPLVYTPGDNEWADCSRAAVGAANPLERLAAVRSTFFPSPGVTLGQNSMNVTEQSGYPENVHFTRDGISFAAVHIVGSNNDLNTWSGYSAPTTAQKAEVTARTNAGISLIRNAFAAAKSSGSRAVVLITQADMFAPGTQGSTYRTAFQSTVRAIASESGSFGKPVFLINGDTHSFASDRPLTTSKWKSFYGISSSVSNLSRVTIKGGNEWMKFTVVSTSAVLQAQRVPLATTTPPPNAAPTASFTSSTTGLTANVNASGSTDSDGTIASYAWNFGDGTTATGVTASRTYAAAGNYTVSLTVTDNGGARATTTRTVTVTAPDEPPPPPPPTGTVIAQDGFGRTVSGGLGTADTGGAWTISGTASNFAVDGSTARVTLPRGSNRYAFLNSVASSTTELRATVSFAKPNASSAYVGVIGRRVGSADYGARVVVNASGAVQVQLLRTTNTVLRSSTLSGVSFASGDRLQIRFQVIGTAPTALQAKVWKVGAAEPASWQVTVTDSTAGLQTAGAVGLYGYLSSSADPVSLVVSYDDFWAGAPG